LGLDACGIVLKSLLGSGLSGYTFAAQHANSNARSKNAAVKLVILKRGVGEFEREVHMHGELRKRLPKHVPDLSSAWVISPSLTDYFVGVMVMEQLGPTVAQLLHQGKITCTDVAEQVTCIAGALTKANVSHGDMHFSNIATKRQGNSKLLLQLIDFGRSSFGAMPTDAYHVWLSASVVGTAMINALHDSGFPGMGPFWELATKSSSKSSGKPPRPKTVAEAKVILTALTAPRIIGAANGAVISEAEALTCPDIKRLDIVVVPTCPTSLLLANTAQG
jgi:hypothetical protein